MAVSAPGDTPIYAPSPLPAPSSPAQPGTYGPTTPAGASTPVRPGTYGPSVPVGVRMSPIDIAIHNESGGQNINQRIHDINTEKGTPARGVLQIIYPTWQAAGRKMGLDLTKYPTAISAPPALQIEVAKTIPFNQWGPSTVAAVRAAYPGINIAGKTLGQIQAEAGGAQPNIPSGAGAAPAPGAATKPSFADAAQKGDVGAMLQALTAEDAKGKSPLGSLGDNLSQNAGGSARSGGAQASTPMAYPAPQADYAGPAGQLMAQVTQLQNKPLSWSAAPFGSGAGMVPGTTLNS